MVHILHFVVRRQEECARLHKWLRGLVGGSMLQNHTLLVRGGVDVWTVDCFV